MPSWTTEFFGSLTRFTTISIIGHVIQTATIFLLAASLGSEEFGQYKRITLVLAFAGLMSFGFREHVYYEMCSSNIPPAELNERFTFFLLMQLAASSILFVVLLWFFDEVSPVVSSCITILFFCSNLSSFYIDYHKAQKEFQLAAFVPFIFISLSGVLFLALSLTGVLHFETAIYALTVSSVSRLAIVAAVDGAVYRIALFT